jgi:hypothetical protein
LRNRYGLQERSSWTSKSTALAAVLLLQVPLAKFGTASADSKNCADVHDAARCKANPHCHWNVDDVGCESGPLNTSEDPCSAHTEKAVCSADATLGCAWKPAQKACVGTRYGDQFTARGSGACSTNASLRR